MRRFLVWATSGLIIYALWTICDPPVDWLLFCVTGLIAAFVIFTYPE